MMTSPNTPNTPLEEDSPDASADQVVTKGIVVIHGVGSEPQSGTLQFMASPLIDWVSQWIQAHDRTLRVNHAGLRFGLTDADPNQSPPHVHISLGDVEADGDSPIGANPEAPDFEKKRGKIKAFHWIIAEAWWAKSSLSPSFTAIFMWLFNHFVRVIGAFWNARCLHIGTLWSDLLGRPQIPNQDRPLPAPKWALWLDLVLTAITLLGSLILAIPGVIGIILISLLSQVPIPAVSTFVLVGPLTSFLSINAGQMFILANDEVQAANFRARLEHTVRWLQEKQQCKEIYVMAHSGGCVVSYETLCAEGDIWKPTAGTPPNVVKLFTMGDGLNIDWRLQPWKWWRRPHQWRLFLPLNPSVTWLDFYAGLDPVSMGSVKVPKHVQDHMREDQKEDPLQRQGVAKPRWNLPVTNWMDVFSDHGGYWENDEEVLSRVACEIDLGRKGYLAERQNSQFYEEHYVESGRRRRLTRVGLLALIRLTFYALVAAALFEPTMLAFGQTVMLWLSNIPGVSGLGGLLNGWISALVAAWGLSPNTPLIGWIGWVINAVPAMLVLGLLYVMLYNVLALACWQQWDVRMRTDAMRQAAQDQAAQDEALPRGRSKENGWKLYHLWVIAALMFPIVTAIVGRASLKGSYIGHVLLIGGIFMVLPLLTPLAVLVNKEVNALISKVVVAMD
jgi:hypothetical protein